MRQTAILAAMFLVIQIRHAMRAPHHFFTRKTSLFSLRRAAIMALGRVIRDFPITIQTMFHHDKLYSQMKLAVFAKNK
jgi:hypothetical protein